MKTKTRPLQSITINTGTRTETPLTVGPYLETLLQPLITEGTGRVPGLAAYCCAITRGDTKGAAEIELRRGRERILRAFLCWLPTDSAEHWQRGCATFAELGLLNHPTPPATPPPLPWLAVILDDGIQFQSPKNLAWLDDFARLLAWAIVEK